MVLRIFTVVLAFGMIGQLACSNGEAAKNTNGAAGDIDGKAIYTKKCALCHGDDGKKGFSGASDLSVSKLSRADQIDIVTYGKGMMNGFSKQLTAAEIEAVVDHVETLKK